MSDVELLQNENQKLRNYISLIFAESELSNRVFEIRQNFAEPSDIDRITVPILDRISKIRSEKVLLEQELHLK